MNELLERPSLASHPRRRHFQTAGERCYTTRQAIAKLNLSRSTFYELRKKGLLPLVRLRQLGRVVKYQAAPIDRWLANRGR